MMAEVTTSKLKRRVSAHKRWAEPGVDSSEENPEVREDEVVFPAPRSSCTQCLEEASQGSGFARRPLYICVRVFRQVSWRIICHDEGQSSEA